MNRDQFEGKWKQFKGKIKEKWGKVTDDDLKKIDGRYDQFLGLLQERYGYDEEQAEKEFTHWNWGERGSMRNQLSEKGQRREQSGLDREGRMRGKKDEDERRKAG
jgi:uncharacterized protein YjbJ (UPF0337 family)